MDLESKQFKHYFIPEWNLLDFEMDENKRTHCIEILQLYSKTNDLAVWFIDSYLKRILELNIKQERQTVPEPFLIPIYFDRIDIRNFRKHDCSSLIRHELSIGGKKYYDLASVLLHVATYLINNKHDKAAQSDAMDIVAEFLRIHSSSDEILPRNFVPYVLQSKWHFVKGRNLLCSTNDHDPLMFRIRIQLSIRFFKAALRTRDQFSGSIQISSKVYLSGLYLLRKKYEKSLMFASSAIVDMEASNNVKSEELDGFTLLFNGEVSMICGFRFLYNHVAEEFEKRSTGGIRKPWNFSFTTSFLA